MRRASLWLALPVLVLAPLLDSCSLISIRTPDKPLSQRDLNARLLTREYAGAFASRVEETANEISARNQDPAIQLNALRWKLAASRASQHTATQLVPMMSLLDTWVLTEQMRQFFATGAGASAFGAEQEKVRALADALAADADKLATGLCSASEYETYHAFVQRFAAEHPLVDLDFARVSAVDQWVAEAGAQASFVDTVGTPAQAVTDIADRMRIASDRVPSQAAWSAQLALHESGYGKEDLDRALAHVNDSLDRLSRLAERSPEEVRGAIGDLRSSMLMLADRFDASWAQMMKTVEVQREALTVTVREEREAATKSLDEQRVAFARDANQFAGQVIEASGLQARRLLRQIVFYGIIVYVVILGLPFAAGFYVGRSRFMRPHS